jgi:TonB-dependent starch-binding outer membrane protein SusC
MSATLGETLDTVAERAGLTLTMSRALLPLRDPVSISAHNATLHDVLDEIAQQVPVRFSITSRGQLLVMSREEHNRQEPTNAHSSVAAMRHIQPGGVTGIVRDAETREPLIGATVYINELETGRATDADGRFELTDIPPGEYSLRVSLIGYTAVVRPISVRDGQRLDLVIELAQDIALLDGVVVTGYSIRQRSMPTGSIERIDGTQIREALIQSPDQALQGRMSGVQVSHTSGQPGSGLEVRIRGLGSINASNTPLYIIDGVQVRTDFTSAAVPDNALTGINPNDIESIEVLKDASATALYGAQGANGVVLITTRQARRGQTRINVSSQTGFNEQPRKLDLMDGPTWTEAMIQGYVNYYVDRGEDPDVRRQMAIERYGDPATAPTYDWQDALTRAGAIQKVNVSASTGLENTRIFVSGAYDFEEGAVLASDFRSLRFRSNIDHRFSDRFTLISRVALASSQGNGLIAGSANINSPFHGGYTQRPIDAIYTEDGGYNHNDIIRVNLVQALNENIRQANTRQLQGSVSGIYMLTNDLSFRTLWGLDFRTVRDRTYTSARLPRYESTGGSLTERFREASSFNTNQVLEYSRAFAQHRLNVLGGFEYRQNNHHSFTASGQQFPNPEFTQLDLAAVQSGMSGRSSESRFAGFLSRADYDYEGRYFGSVSLRYDGSSRFGMQNQWGLFYSGALAWDIAREGFMSGVAFLDALKLRTSYGITGNSDISDFAARSLFGSGGNYDGFAGLRPFGLGNDLLTWEEAHTLDLGIEFSFLSDRFYGDINRFNTRNKNLLLAAWLPNDSGFSSITRNSGVVENRGWEIGLGARWFARGNFTWSTDFNFTHQSNEIIELVDDLEILGSSIRVGHPIDIIWANPFAGINPADGRAFWYDSDGELTYTRSSADQQMVGKYSPDFFGGLTNAFGYGNFRLTTFFQYEYGRSALNATVGRRMLNVSTERGLMARVATDAWQNPGDLAQLPRHYISSSFIGSSSHDHVSLFVKDASYIRLKEVRLDYNVPTQLAGVAGFNAMNVFLQARNLVTWTNYPYGDPEFVGQGTGAYPQSRQVTLGLGVQF